ncbi:ABC transporter substrate-binding protein [Nesterenkonia sp. NBAIMH1]|uniref:ABC transporter substrate-binding protein n=1 Tax=Nesterenkonia sp. NBAIMH1 TaxID=2600320 RepID=UPI0011B54CF3|nr:ABC transporter substrate-binding protein [Nesterenkonia sp. NBAIMH1]
MTSNHRTLRTAAFVSIASLALTGCSDAVADDEEEMPAETSEAAVGYFPLAHTATAVHGVENGLFDAHNLDVELVETEGGAEAIAALVSGQYDITYSNYTSAVLANAQGLPLVIVAANDVGADDHGVFVSPDSDIESLDDLAGTTATVNNLQNIGTIAYYSHMEAAGESPEDINLVEMPNPDMRSALDSGSVDAIWQVEPFQTMAANEGYKRIDNLFSGEMEGAPVAGWVTTEEFAEENPEILRAFQAAMSESTQELNDDGDITRDLVPTFTMLEEDLIEDMELPQYQSDLDLEWLQRMVELMEGYGMLDESFSIEDMVFEAE